MAQHTFTWLTNIGSQLKQEPKVHVTKFGEYEERVPVGINSNPQSWSVKFDRTRAQCLAILAFLKARNATEAFNWKTPYEETGTYVCRKWNSSSESGYLVVTAEFDQVFE